MSFFIYHMPRYEHCSQSPARVEPQHISGPESSDRSLLSLITPPMQDKADQRAATAAEAGEKAGQKARSCLQNDLVLRLANYDFSLSSYTYDHSP